MLLSIKTKDEILMKRALRSAEIPTTVALYSERIQVNQMLRPINGKKNTKVNRRTIDYMF
jgi:hypothetical protein